MGKNQHIKILLLLVLLVSTDVVQAPRQVEELPITIQEIQ